MDASYGHNSGEEPRKPPRITAELVRVEAKKVDIKLVINGEMHLLAWRRHAFHDEVTVNGVRQHESRGIGKRETLYGLVFGKSREGEGGLRLLFTVDPRQDMNTMDWSGHTRLRGVRLESAEGVLMSYGNLDPRAYTAPTTFAEWLKKSLGIMSGG
jgi:hypothetical protein